MEITFHKSQSLKDTFINTYKFFSEKIDTIFRKEIVSNSCVIHTYMCNCSYVKIIPTPGDVPKVERPTERDLHFNDKFSVQIGI